MLTPELTQLKQHSNLTIHYHMVIMTCKKGWIVRGAIIQSIKEKNIIMSHGTNSKHSICFHLSLKNWPFCISKVFLSIYSIRLRKKHTVKIFLPQYSLLHGLLQPREFCFNNLSPQCSIPRLKIFATTCVTNDAVRHSKLGTGPLNLLIWLYMCR